MEAGRAVIFGCIRIGLGKDRLEDAASVVRLVTVRA